MASSGEAGSGACVEQHVAAPTSIPSAPLLHPRVRSGCLQFRDREAEPRPPPWSPTPFQATPRRRALSLWPSSGRGEVHTTAAAVDHLRPVTQLLGGGQGDHPAQIHTGCSNNNYASRKNCKKCGLPKEEAAMPALSMGGMLPAYADYMARVQQIANAGYKMNFGMPGSGNSALQQQLLANANWPYGMAGRYGMQSSAWPFGGSTTNQFQGAPKDWRDGDWLCSCGFHNYSSRTQCKECSAPVPSGMASTTMKTTGADTSSTLGNKRLASEELANDWDNKRLNPGNVNYPLSTAGSNQGAVQTSYSGYDNGNSTALPSGQVPAMSGVVGQGKWREGDWLCTNCNNHNYASRAFCNRCKSQKESSVHPGAL